MGRVQYLLWLGSRRGSTRTGGGGVIGVSVGVESHKDPTGEYGGDVAEYGGACW